ncbi:MAG: hypothetical protein K2X84_01440 [Beijerinckiaceae bacterium]|jgi:hypothetical protein|nr:hypothetical protein [Beijerinckiaceae bacterium]MBY0361848.1 hypothetical protein [Phreatobacter sp.]
MTDSVISILTHVAFRTEILLKPVRLVCLRRAGAAGQACRNAAAKE